MKPADSEGMDRPKPANGQSSVQEEEVYAFELCDYELSDIPRPQQKPVFEELYEN